MGRKHCGKRRNCSLRAISPFPTVFSKGLFPRGVKRCHCVGMGFKCLICLSKSGKYFFPYKVSGPRRSVCQILLSRLFPLYKGKPLSFLAGEPVPMESEIMRVVSPSIMEISRDNTINISIFRVGIPLPFPKRHILGSSKLKQSAHDNCKFDENGRKFSNG